MSTELVCGYRIRVRVFHFDETYDMIGRNAWSAILGAAEYLRKRANLHEDVPIWVEARKIYPGGRIAGSPLLRLEADNEEGTT